MEIIALQIDLGRQKERFDFIENIVDFAKKWGYNTIILYLECSVRTSVTPFLDVDDTYSLEEIKAIDEYIEGRGLNAIPAFENFYHIEKLLRYDEAKGFAEFEDERVDGRGWMSERFKRGAVGCTSNPEFNKFFDKYITEITSVFSGKYVHMGLDEIFEFAECPKCLERRKSGVSKKDIFLSQILHNYELAKSMGKIMLMWDDFFEYYNVLDSLPRDIILCHWNYGFIGSETKGHWTNRVRKDWLSIYDRLGFKYIFCAYGSNASSTYNVDTLTDYALKHKPMGAILTIWERAASFYNGIYPIIALSGELWNGKIKTFSDKVRVYSEVLGSEEIAKTLLKTQVLTSCLFGTNVGEKAEDDNFAKLLYRGALEEFVEKIRAFLTSDCVQKNSEQYDILLDIYDFALEKYLLCKTNSLGAKIFDEYEKQCVGLKKADFNEVFGVLDQIEKSFCEINLNCDYLWEKYRGGIKSSGGLMEQTASSRAGLAQSVKNSIAKNQGCGVLYLDMITPDGFGSPKMKIKIKYAGENAEELVYFGSVKPEAVTFDLGGSSTVRFAIKNKLIDYVVLECLGEDSLFVCNVRYLALGKKYAVKRAEKTSGKVLNEQNVAVGDTTFAELGYSSGIEHLNDVTLAKKPSGIKLEFSLLA